MTKIQLLSDTHSREFEIDPSVNFAIHAGDITNTGFRQRTLVWDESVISFEKSKQPIYWIPGNHDINFKEDTELGTGNFNVLNKVATYIEPTFNYTTEKRLTIKGVSLSVCYNLPALASYWDFMTANRYDEKEYYEKQLDKYYDIIVSHSPPNGDIGSEIECGDIGSGCLLEYIEEYQPRLVVCGHVHHPLTRKTVIGKTTVINVAQDSVIYNI